MASIYYAKKNTAWSLPVLLFPQDSTEYLASPTIVGGDFLISTYDNTGTNETGASNLTNTPVTSPASSGIVPIKLTATEMNHDIVVVTWKDAAGDEWASGAFVVLTTPHALGEAALEATLTTIDSNVDNILADTNELQTDWADAGRLDAILDARASQSSVDGLNNLSAAEVNAEVDTALAEYDAPTKAELDSGLAALNDPTEATIADAVWDEAASGHTTAGTFGKHVADVVDDTGTSGVVVASIATDAVNAAALASDAIAEINATVDTAISDASLATAASVAALNDLSAAEVNAEVVDALSTDTYAEPTSAPAATASLAAKIGWLMKLARNKLTQNSTTQTLYADDGTTADNTTTVSDDGDVFTRGEWS